MPKFARAAAYLPSYQAEGRRVAGPDEDEFTVAATALERVMDREDPRGTSSLQIELVGSFPERLDWGLGAMADSLAPVRRSGEGGPSLLRALASATEEEGHPRVVLSVELPERSEGLATPRSGPGSGSVAFLFREGGTEGISERLGRVRAQASALGTAFDVYRAAPDAGPPTWVGDWSADPSSARPVDLSQWARHLHPSSNGVSQGAYIPLPRYRESVPSRWRFVGQRCPRCGALSFPARGVCRACAATEGLADVRLPRDEAVVVATTTIGAGGQPTEFDVQVEEEGAYEVVLADLAPGVRVTLQVADAEPGSLAIGDRVDTRLRRLYSMEGDWRYGRKAVPRPKPLD